jgi:tetratricopeptide (TPR) repeat protein
VKTDHECSAENSEVHSATSCPFCGANSPSFARFEAAVCDECLLNVALGQPFDTGEDHAHRGVPADGIRTLGSYFVFEEIGRGGMGVIYRAVHRETGKILALKTVLPQYVQSLETLARFELEAEAASSLVHPHSMRIYEVGRGSGDVPFFTMDLAAGGSLYQLRDKFRGRWRQIAQLLVKIAGAVQHAHDRGILHRDLKPGNILFTEDQEPMVTDFGIAKRLAASSPLTSLFGSLGTPNYVAPEQAAGESETLTPAADVYSLGAIFYELLTGQPPIVGDNRLKILPSVTRSAPRKPRQINPIIPRGLETICMRCLERQPSRRYQSARELSDDLGRWLGGQKISRQAVAFRLWSDVQIHREAICWCVACAAIIYGLWLWVAPPRQMVAAFSHSPTLAIIVDDLDPGSVQRGFAQAAAKELKNDLRNIQAFRVLDSEGLKVTMDSGVLDPVGCGRSLGAEFVLAGNVRYMEQNARIVLRLLRSDNGDVLWYSGKTMPVNQRAAAVRDLSQAVAQTLQATPKVSSQVSPLSKQPDAVTLFLRARELTTRVNRRDLESAVALFRQSVVLDPNFGEARSMLAYALITQVALWGENDQLPSALVAARDALSCNPYSALAHRALGYYYFVEADYPKAVPELWEALQLNPSSAGANMALGDCLREMGHPGAAVFWNERAAKLEPVHFQFHTSEAESLMLLGQDDRALAALQRCTQLDPDLSDALLFSSVLRMWQKKFDEARSLCTAARTKAQDVPAGLTVAAMIDFFSLQGDRGERDYEKLRDENRYQQTWPFFGAVNPSSALACLAGDRGDTVRAQQLTREALSIDQKLLATHPHNCRILHDIAATLSVKGDSQGAIKLLEEAISEGWVEHRSTAIDPRFRLLTKTPAFTSLLSRTFPRPLPECTNRDGR